VIYTIEMIGGPRDGQESLSVRPYHELKLSDGTLYAADPDAPDFLEWISDDERRIRLSYVAPADAGEGRGKT